MANERRAVAILALWPMFLAGCGVSTRELPSATSEVTVDIMIQQETRRVTDGADWDYAEVKGELRNAKGKAIEKGDVQLLLNGEPLHFVVGTGNYYDRHPFYQASDEQLERLKGNAECVFELVWPDGTKHAVGSIRTPAQLSIDQFTFPRAYTQGGRLAFGWRDVTSRAEVTVYRGYRYIDDLGNAVSQVGTSEEKSAIRKTIGPGLFKKETGELTVPAAFFAQQPGDLHTGEKPRSVEAVYVDVVARTSAPVAGAFGSGSRLRAERKIEFYIEVSPR